MSSTTRHFSSFLLAILFAASSQVSFADGWNFMFEPYGMASNIEGDASVGRVTGAPVDVDFDTILENLELAGMLHEFTASASLATTYQFNERYILDMKYKGLWVDYNSGSSGNPDFFEYDPVTHGPVVGPIINI